MHAVACTVSITFCCLLSYDYVDIKLPDEHSESPRSTLSPENRMNEYMKKHKYMLGESITESGDHFTEDPSISSYSVKKVTFSDSQTERTCDLLPVCPVNGHATSGVANFVTKDEATTESSHNHVNMNSHDSASLHKEGEHWVSPPRGHNIKTISPLT